MYIIYINVSVQKAFVSVYQELNVEHSFAYVPYNIF